MAAILEAVTEALEMCPAPSHDAMRYEMRCGNPLLLSIAKPLITSCFSLKCRHPPWWRQVARQGKFGGSSLARGKGFVRLFWFPNVLFLFDSHFFDASADRHRHGPDELVRGGGLERGQTVEIGVYLD